MLLLILRICLWSLIFYLISMYKVHIWNKYDKCYNAIRGIHERSFADGLRDLGFIVFCVPFNYTQN